jgi:hypothetical protein
MLFLQEKKEKRNCCKSFHYIKGAKEGAYKFELCVVMHYHDDHIYIHISFYVFI